MVAYWAEQGVPYTQTGLWQAYRTVIHYLNSVGLWSTQGTRVPADGSWGIEFSPSVPR